MKTKTCTFLIIASILLVAVSCKKSADPVTPPIVFSGVYQASNTIDLSDVFMYTMNGAVTNQDFIKAYLKRHDVYEDSHFAFTAAITRDNSDSQINFADSGRVKLSKGLDRSYPATDYTITQRTTNGFILEAINASIYGQNNNGGRASTLMNDAGNLQKLMNSTHKVAYQFIIKDGQPYLCLFSCIINTNFNNTAFSSSYIWNYSGSFNRELLKELVAGDTIVYQSKTVLFKKN